MAGARAVATRKGRVGDPALRSEKTLDRGADEIDLVAGVMRADGEAEDFVGEFFGERKIAAFPAALAVGVREVRRDRIMNARADTLGCEVGLQGVAAGGANDEEVPNGFGPSRDVGQREVAGGGEGSELRVVAGGEGSAAGVPGGEVR